jgi:hypothetical protein
VQILAYADNTTIMGRTLKVMMEASSSSARKSKKMGLIRNKEKMKFMFGPTNNILQLLICIYTECPRRNVPNFGKVFLMLKYTDITHNTYIQS